jgi:hypothetical protein
MLVPARAVTAVLIRGTVRIPMGRNRYRVVRDVLRGSYSGGRALLAAWRARIIQTAKRGTSSEDAAGVLGYSHAA